MREIVKVAPGYHWVKTTLPGDLSEIAIFERPLSAVFYKPQPFVPLLVLHITFTSIIRVECMKFI